MTRANAEAKALRCGRIRHNCRRSFVALARRVLDVLVLLVCFLSLFASAQDGTTGFQYDNAGNLTAIFGCTVNRCGRLDVPACPTGNNCCACRCSDPTSDPNNCGGCGNRCPGDPHGQATCISSVCGLQCNSGYGLCGGSCIAWDPDHCGSCTNSCPAAPLHGYRTCTGLPPQCGFGCYSPYSPCGNSCVDTTSDVNNCGSCGHQCPGDPHGQAACVNSQCTLICQGDYSVCGTTCVDLRFDWNNCGTCGHVCGADSNQCCYGNCCRGAVCCTDGRCLDSGGVCY